jgi:hypothetical protein
VDKEWKSNGMNSANVSKPWQDNGFSAVDAARWTRNGITAERAKIWVSHGHTEPREVVSVDQMASNVELLIELLQSGKTLTEIETELDSSPGDIGFTNN